MSVKRCTRLAVPQRDLASATAGARTLPNPDDLLPHSIHIHRSNAARYLSLGTTMLDKLIATGELPTVRIGRRVMIHRYDRTAYVELLEGLRS